VRVPFLCLMLLGVLFASAQLPAAATDTVAAILANPSAYDGKSVELIGNVKDSTKESVVVKTIPVTWYRTQFCDAPNSCIFAINFTPVKFDPTQTTRLRGTYWADHWGTYRFHFINRIETKDLGPAPAAAPSPVPSGP
jgi:hypothetical protein